MASILAATAASVIATISPAHAGPISIGGDSNWGISAQSTVSTHYPTLGKSVAATASIKFDAHFLGIPLPVRGYYSQSYPHSPFAVPTLLSANATLASTSYRYQYDSFLGKNAWMVSGNSEFWGDKSVAIKGTGKTDTRGATGYVRGGTGTGHSIDANSLDYIKVS